MKSAQDRTLEILRWWGPLFDRLAGITWRSCDDCGTSTRDYVSPRGALCDACALRRADRQGRAP